MEEDADLLRRFRRNRRDLRAAVATAIAIAAVNFGLLILAALVRKAALAQHPLLVLVDAGVDNPDGLRVLPLRRAEAAFCSSVPKRVM